MNTYTFWDKAERFPPVLVRLLARHRHGPPLTDHEISKATGLPPVQVQCISHCTSWHGIDLPTMRSFLMGCGVDFENVDQLERVDSYLRSKPAPTWKYLRLSPNWAFYKQLMMLYKNSLKARNER